MKKAIVVVSGSTTDNEKLKLDKIKNKFPDYEVRRAVTSHCVIEKIVQGDGIQINTTQQVLKQLQIEGYEEVIFVSLKEPQYILKPCV